jgi:hypothetical protein
MMKIEGGNGVGMLDCFVVGIFVGGIGILLSGRNLGTRVEVRWVIRIEIHNCRGRGIEFHSQGSHL